ncbi:unnamed protein product [Caenorhabditis brenneri]
MKGIIFGSVMFMFIAPVVDDVTMNVTIHKKNLKSVAICQIVASFVLLISISSIRTWLQITLIGLSQLSFILTSSWFIADCLTMMESELELLERNNPDPRKDEKDDEDSESPDSDSDVEDTMDPVTELSVTTCKICLRGFSETSKRRAPLMLRCGHTLCWNCCKELKKQNLYMHVTCPFCRKETFCAWPILPLSFFLFWGLFIPSVNLRPYYLSFLIITSTSFSICCYTASSISKKYGQGSKLEYYGKLQKVGSGIIAFMGVFLNFAVCMFGQNDEILIGFIFSYTITFETVVFMFIAPVVDDLTMNVELHKKNLILVAICQIAGSLVLLISISSIRTPTLISLTGLIQMSFIMTSSWSIANCLTMMESELELRERNIPEPRRDEEDDEDSEASDSDSSVEDTMKPVTELSVTTCKICLRGFSENVKRRAPLMLRCGHTLCRNCCKELKKQNLYMHVTCPFCRKETFCDSLEELPKNYAVIEMIQMKNQRRLLEI